MSWAHDDLIRETGPGSAYSQLQPQQKMAKCKVRREIQVQRWFEYDRFLNSYTNNHQISQNSSAKNINNLLASAGKINNSKQSNNNNDLQGTIFQNNNTNIFSTSFQYHKPRRKIRPKKDKISRAIAASENGISFQSNVALLDAVNRGDYAEVQYMLSNGANPNASDEDGLTALHQACIDNCENIVRLLLENGSNVDCRDSEDWTPLHACTTCGHQNIASILLEYGANILALNADLSMPYDICEDDSPMLEFIERAMEKRQITQDQINQIRALPEQRIIEDIQREMMNSRSNNQNISRQTSVGNNSTIMVINNIANKNLPHLNSYNVNNPLPSSNDQHTLLHVAAANDYVTLCRYLLEELQANPNVQDKDGWTPAHAACCWSHKDILSLLVDFGADFNIINCLNEKPLDVTEEQDLILFVSNLLRDHKNKERDLQRQRQQQAALSQQQQQSTANNPFVNSNENHPANNPSNINRNSTLPPSIPSHLNSSNNQNHQNSMRLNSLRNKNSFKENSETHNNTNNLGQYSSIQSSYDQPNQTNFSHHPSLSHQYSFTRSTGSRRSARSQSFRRRSLRKQTSNLPNTNNDSNVNIQNSVNHHNHHPLAQNSNYSQNNSNLNHSQMDQINSNQFHNLPNSNFNSTNNPSVLSQFTNLQDPINQELQGDFGIVKFLSSL